MNILLDSKSYPRLFDFSSYVYNSVPVEFSIYTAPEFFNGDDHYSYAVDVYSFAMILYEFYTGSNPNNGLGKTKFQIMKNIIRGMRHDLAELSDGPVKELIRNCWNQSPEERPKFDDIIRCYTIKRDDYWPPNVDAEEVEDYLKKFGLSLDPNEIEEFFRKNPAGGCGSDSKREKDNDNDNDDDDDI